MRETCCTTKNIQRERLDWVKNWRGDIIVSSNTNVEPKSVLERKVQWLGNNRMSKEYEVRNSKYIFLVVEIAEILLQSSSSRKPLFIKVDTASISPSSS